MDTNLLISGGAIGILQQLFSTFPDSAQVREYTLRALRAFCECDDQIFLSLFTEHDLLTMCLSVLSPDSDSAVIGESLRILNNWFANSELMIAYPNPDFEVQFLGILMTLISSKEDSLLALALNSLRFFCSNCCEASISQLFECNALEVFAELLLSDSNLKTSCLLAILPLTGFQDQFAKPFVPLISQLLSESEFAKFPRQALLAVTAILSNFAASDDPDVVGFVLSPPGVAFLNHILSEHSYVLQRQAVKAFCFLAISVPGDFWRIVVSENQRWLALVIEELGSAEESVAIHCIESLFSLSQYVSADALLSEQFLEQLRDGDVEQHLDAILDMSSDPLVIEFANGLLGQLEG
jgi:hypothetical protein